MPRGAPRRLDRTAPERAEAAPEEGGAASEMTRTAWRRGRAAGPAIRLWWAAARWLSGLAAGRSPVLLAKATGSGQLPHEQQPGELIDAPAPVRWAESAQVRGQASRLGRGQSPGHQRPVRPRRARRAVREPGLRRRPHRRVGEPARSCLGGRRDDRPPATTRGSSPRDAPDGSARSTSHGASPRLSPDLSRPGPPWGGPVGSLSVRSGVMTMARGSGGDRYFRSARRLSP